LIDLPQLFNQLLLMLVLRLQRSQVGSSGQTQGFSPS
jgi:hypothetical protein